MRVTYKQAEEAVKTLLLYIGENPNREGLLETPRRVLESYQEFFSGYQQDLSQILSKNFHEIANFHEQVWLRNINFSSFCEHHMLPIIGTIDLCYIPVGAVIGISKLIRAIEVFTRRLQIQERLTAEIAENLHHFLNTKGVAIRVSGIHHCTAIRGVVNHGSVMDTFHYTGLFSEEKYRLEFLSRLKA